MYSCLLLLALDLNKISNKENIAYSKRMMKPELLKEYQELDIQKKRMLFIFAAFNTDIASYELTPIINKLGDGKSIPAYKIKMNLEHLTNRGLLIMDYCNYRCPDEIVDDILVDYLKLDTLGFESIFKFIEADTFYSYYTYDNIEILRKFRCSIYTKNIVFFNRLLDNFSGVLERIIPLDFLELILKDEIPDTLNVFDEYYYLFLNFYSFRLVRSLQPIPSIEMFPAKYRNKIQEGLMFAQLFKGVGLDSIMSPTPPFMLALNHLLTGEIELARKETDLFLSDFQSETKSRKKYIPRLGGLVYILSRICSNEINLSELRPFVNNYVNIQKGSVWVEMMQPVQVLIKLIDKKARMYDLFAFLNYHSPIVSCFAIICISIVDVKALINFKSKVISLKNLTFESDYDWLSEELSFILGRMADSNYKPEACKNIIPITSHVIIKENWEKALIALNQLQQKKESTNGVNSRLIWEVSIKHCLIKPIEQRLGKTGKWSKGKAVSLKRLKETHLDFCTEQDHRLITNIKKGSGYYGSDYYFDEEKAFVDLVGHPYVFKSGQPDYTIEIVKKEPELHVSKVGKHYVLELPEVLFKEGIEIQEETLTRYTVLAPDDKQRQIAETLKQRKIKVPVKAQSLLEEVIKNISSSITINSDFIQDNIPFVEADSQPFVQMVPSGTGLRVKLLVKPLGGNGTCFTPGEGRANIIGLIGGEKHQTRRDLTKETKLSHKLVSLCASLSVWSDGFDDLDFDEPHDCLDLIAELRDANIKVEWPEGEKLKLVKGTAGFSGLNLKVEKKNDWFSYEGEVEINENLSLTLQKILELNKNSQQRFIKLDDGSFLEMSKEFRKQIQKLNAFSVDGSDELLVHPLALSSLSDFEDRANVLSGDSHWDKQKSKIQKMNKLKPKLPDTLDAELRPYQEDGYKWMAKLAHWGVGACLADDMGLGKTIQIISILLQRASKGAALVVVPASVCGNWQSEIKKFAPTLNPVLVYDLNKSFDLADFGPFDVPIISYGLLVSRSKEVTEKKWHTLILDEAHAIKNNNTKRYKAAMKLKAGFKIVATGTPIQNHLGELWSLFQFINPGFLGSLKQFSDRFITATSVEEGQQKKNHLKKLITPFILRRTKRQVLDDLPEKTEIVLNVDFSDEERAFYEALRLQAIENIENPDENKKAGKHMKILAEITKLRQACCHPKLAQKDSTLSSSKLEVFEQTIDELRENNHRVLVFSQFTSYLKMAEEILKKKKISYQYLDGSTPLKVRDKSVKAFQGGEGEVFLISLKAGGLGLNLTAADYVIHMDPWWNPAIEDQASDRAHRFGQTRPVTIYRLITKGTIEEKIVKLHHNKRELADNLLAGTDKGNKLSSEELLKILMEG